MAEAEVMVLPTGNYLSGEQWGFGPGRDVVTASVNSGRLCHRSCHGLSLGPFLGVPSQCLSTPFRKLSLKMQVLVSQAPSGSSETPREVLQVISLVGDKNGNFWPEVRGMMGRSQSNELVA